MTPSSDLNPYVAADEAIRVLLLEVLRETVDRISEHCIFQEESGRHLPWTERSRLSVRFRLVGAQGATYSDEWAEVEHRLGRNRKRPKRYLTYLPRREGGPDWEARVLRLAQPWERDATRDLLRYLNAARKRWRHLAQARRGLLEASRIAGQPFSPQPLPKVRQRHILDAMRGMDDAHLPMPPMREDTDHTQRSPQTPPASQPRDIYDPFRSDPR